MAKRRISWYFRCRRRAASGPFGLTFICNTLWLQKGPDASPFHERENSSPRPEAAKTGRTPGIRGQNARGSETSEIAGLPSRPFGLRALPALRAAALRGRAALPYARSVQSEGTGGERGGQRAVDVGLCLACRHSRRVPTPRA